MAEDKRKKKNLQDKVAGDVGAATVWVSAPLSRRGLTLPDICGPLF